MKEPIKHSVIPIYLVGVVWLVHAALLPLYQPVHFILCAMESFVAFLLGKAIFPDQLAAPAGNQNASAGNQNTGTSNTTPAANPEVEALLAERQRVLSEMRRLNHAIEDPSLSAHIDHLELVTAKILDHVAEHPQKLPQIRRFLDYYLPTTLKLLNAYDRMDDAGVSGNNINATKEKVERMMDTISAAFDKQLDALFGEEALDISTDITVMENLLAQEGFRNASDESGLHL